MKLKTFYLLTFKDQNGHSIFHQEKYRKLFYKLYEYFLANEVSTYSWCILPEKALFLCSIKSNLEEYAISKKMLIYKKEGLSLLINLFNDYLKNQNENKLFMDKDVKILDHYPTSFLTGFSSYIHCLPVFQKLSETCADYKWSSYRPVLDQKRSFLHTKTVLGWFGGAEEYQKFHEQMLEIKKGRDLCKKPGNFFR